jgi:ketosteroid isomerase-like protein
MSQENVEIVRRFYEAGQRSLEAYWKNPRSGAAALGAGDLDPETEAVLAFLHPEVEYRGVPSPLEGGIAHGHLGYLKAWDAYLGAAEDARMTVKELVDLGADEVLGVGELTVRWMGSGMTLTEPRFAVLTLREGLVVRFSVYRDRQEALEAVGLSE